MKERLHDEVTENFLRTAKYLAKKKCKDCYGKGYKIMKYGSLPGDLAVEKYSYCHCTQKKK